LRPDAENKEHHEKVLWMFLNKGDELSENEVDAVVDMDIESSLEVMLRVAVDACVKYIGVKMPTQEEMEEALGHAKAYSAIQGDKKQAAEASKPKKSKGPRYYGFLPETNVIGEVKSQLKDENTIQFIDNLEKLNRLASNPHITLVHSKNLPRDQELWDYCQALRELLTPPVFRLEFGHVIWNARVMTLSVDGLAVHAEGQGGKGNEGARLLELLSPNDLKGLHLTVGTADASINPFEAKALVEEWKNKHEIMGAQGGVVKLEGIASTAWIHGLFS
jgi:tRNA ligase